MHFTTLAMPLLSALAANAVPSTSLERRYEYASGGIGRIDVCFHAGYKQCHEFTSNAQCIDLSDGDGVMNNQVSSLKPSKGTICTFYQDTGCRKGDEVLTAQDGYTVLKAALTKLNVNDQITSFVCYAAA